jgi:hypothetical protein
MSEAASLYGERYCWVFEEVRNCGDCNVYPCPVVGGPALARLGGCVSTNRVSPEHHRAASESAVAGWELRRRRAART